jgi:hypothetical protein
MDAARWQQRVSQTDDTGTELQERPGDLEGHAAHRDKLCQHIRALHAHIERLQKRTGAS